MKLKDDAQLLKTFTLQQNIVRENRLKSNL